MATRIFPDQVQNLQELVVVVFLKPCVGCTNNYIHPQYINSTAHPEYRLSVNATFHACTRNTNKDDR